MLVAVQDSLLQSLATAALQLWLLLCLSCELEMCVLWFVQQGFRQPRFAATLDCDSRLGLQGKIQESDGPHRAEW